MSLLLAIVDTRQKEPPSAASPLGARWQPQLEGWRHHRRRAPALAHVAGVRVVLPLKKIREISVRRKQSFVWALHHRNSRWLGLFFC